MKILRKITILKLGGSILTNKSQPYHCELERIKQIAKEIKYCFDSQLVEELILVHGVGSFGHPPVIEHKLYLGFKNKEQLLPLSATQQKVNEFRAILSNELRNVGIPVNLMHPSSLSVTEKGEFIEFFTEAIEGYLSLGMVPLIGGDMIFDRKMGFAVGSGDQIAVNLAKKLKASQLFFATDVEGIYDNDPRIKPDSKLITCIKSHDIVPFLEQMNTGLKSDASGLMKGKLKSISTLSKEIANGLDVAIFSMKNYGSLIQLLEGKLTRFTKIGL
jgi:isopentenyl phosphate kinase